MTETQELTTQPKTDMSVYDEPEGSAGQFRIAEVRASGGMSDTDIEQGHLYLRDFNVPQGEDPVDIDLGPEIRIIVLRDAKRLQFYDSDLNRTMIDSTEFRSWDDQIVLFRYITDNEGRYQPRMEAVLPYKSQMNGPCMKEFKEEKFPNQVKMKYRAYALMKEERQETCWRIVLLNMTNADMVGADKDSRPRFENADPDSFEACKRDIYKDASKKQMFNHSVKVGTFKVNNKIMRKTFEVIDRLEEGMRDTVTQALHELYGMLEIQTKRKIARAVENTDLSKVTCVNPQYVEDIQMDQKPLLSIARYGKHQPTLPGETLSKIPRKLIESPKREIDYAEPDDEETVGEIADALEGKKKDGEAESPLTKVFKKGDVGGKKKS